ncbi:MAG: hypothetical protein HZB41_01255 [Ignavibacteriae bacterium]|nr:hypothetical protein [Ignavibacteriota bacterium]
MLIENLVEYLVLLFFFFYFITDFITGFLVPEFFVITTFFFTGDFANNSLFFDVIKSIDKKSESKSRTAVSLKKYFLYFIEIEFSRNNPFSK